MERSFSACVVLALLTATVQGEVLKMGGPIQSSGVGYNGKMGWELWKDWVNDAENGQGFTVELHWGSTEDIAGVTASITKQTDCDPACVDVFIAPYGSGGSITAINAIDASFTGPVIVWGGASESIFTTHCADKSFTCFGTFTTASNYMTTGLAEIAGKASSPLSVAFVENANAFSKSVCDGAKLTVTEGGGNLQVGETLALSEKSSVPEADMAKIDTLIATEPDVLVLCGHNGFVEPIVTQVGLSSKRPKAIIGTNTITSTSLTNFGGNASFAQCVLMPTQWAGADTPDSITGLTSTMYKSIMPEGTATYHAASATAAGIAVIHAMAAGTEGTRVADLTNLLQAVDTDSFYGKIKFNSHGNILKPMYTQQKLDDGSPIVAPPSAKTTDMNYPLDTCSSWTLAGSPTATPSPSSGDDVDGAFNLHYKGLTMLFSILSFFLSVCA